MRLCLYNGTKKKKTVSKKSKKSNTLPASTKKPANKKQSSGTVRTSNAAKSKKTDRKKNTPAPVQDTLDPPSLLSKLTPSQCKGKSNEAGALNFWKFVDAYTSIITKEDMNYLNSLTKMYTKENCPSMNMMPSNHSSNTCSPDFPDDWVERIVGALVDPDLFPSEDHDSDSKRMKTDDLDSRRLKLCDPMETMGVFSDRSNCREYLHMGSGYADNDEEDLMTNCDMKSNQDECDEISEEILKCQEDLRLLCRQNETSLSLLTSRAQRALESQHLKHSLGVCENELVKLTQQKHKEQRLKKETVTSASKKSKNDKELLLQRRELLLTSLGDKQV